MGKRHFFKVEESYHGQRLDKFLTDKLPDLSRSFLQEIIKSDLVKVDGQNIKPNYRLKTGQEVELCIPPPKKISLEPENIELDIVYQDDDIAVINKPQGMVVHPAPGNYSGTLVNALLYHCDQLSGINGKIRPGIVHRIDKDTSGLLVIAKNDRAHHHLARQIAERTIKRVYWAIVENNIIEDEGTIDVPIKRHPIHRKKMAVIPGPSSRRAVTHFRVLERFGEYTLVEARLETGRTHQIRVHMSHIKHPIVGDTVYGSKKQKFNLKGQALHAKILGLVHPTKEEYMEFSAPLPPYFEELLKKLRNMVK